MTGENIEDVWRRSEKILFSYSNVYTLSWAHISSIGFPDLEDMIAGVKGNDYSMSNSRAADDDEEDDDVLGHRHSDLGAEDADSRRLWSGVDDNVNHVASFDDSSSGRRGDHADESRFEQDYLDDFESTASVTSMKNWANVIECLGVGELCGQPARSFVISYSWQFTHTHTHIHTKVESKKHCGLEIMRIKFTKVCYVTYILNGISRLDIHEPLGHPMTLLLSTRKMKKVSI